MTILNDMGIQQWRVRRSAAEIEADSSQASLVVSNGANAGEKQASSNSDAPSIVQPSTQTNSSRAAIQTEQRIWPVDTPKIIESSTPLAKPSVAQVSEDKKSLLGTDAPSRNEPKLKPTIAPSPMPVSNQSSADNSVAKVPKPLPAPMPAPIAGSISEPITSQMVSVNEPSLIDEPVSKISGGLAGLGWNDLHAMVNGWQNCPSCGDNKALLGHGDENADWFFLSDAPSTAEVSQKSLFAGRSGQLFEAILSALGLQRESVYSTSLFKCVASDDMNIIPACDNILQRQIELVNPKVVITFGEFTAQTLLKANASLDILRAQDQRCINSKVLVIPTYTPAQMLDDGRLKSLVWADLKKAIAIVNMPT